MLIEQTEDMTERERIAVQNSNNQFLQAISYVAVGTIFSYAGKTVPETFMLCDGRSLDKTEYEELFNVIGYTFGGSGESFKLPDLRGKTLVGVSSADTNFDSVGKTGGEKEHTLTVNEMPKHAHITKFTADKAANVGTERIQVSTVGGWENGYTGNEMYVGDNQPHNNMPPYLVCNYIIKVANSVMKDDFRFPIDQNFDPQSENAQSGKALAVEFNKKADRNKILDYIVYTVDTGKEEVTIADCDTSISGSHSIPDIIEGYPVTNIDPDAFRGCTLIESLVIPDNVTRIGCNAFKNCYKLVSITMPKHLDNIQDYVFEGCEILKHIYIPDTLTYIDSYAFAESSIEHIYFEGSKEQWESICDGLEESEGITIHYNQRPATVDYVNSKLGDIESLLGGI